jgi:hypothetical protein
LRGEPHVAFGGARLGFEHVELDGEALHGIAAVKAE